jgi:hypothetical protein
MKKVLATLSAIALSLTLGLANADEAKGIVKDINAAEGWLTLTDGTRFQLGEGAAMEEGIKAGDEVTVSYKMMDGKKVASDVEKAD